MVDKRGLRAHRAWLVLGLLVSSPSAAVDPGDPTSGRPLRLANSCTACPDDARNRDSRGEAEKAHVFDDGAASADERATKLRTKPVGQLAASTNNKQHQEGAERVDVFLLEEEKERSSCTTAEDEVVRQAQTRSGTSRLCDDWDVVGALGHFLAAAQTNARHGGDLPEKEWGQEKERKEGKQLPNCRDFGWGAVWLAQALQGRSQEASAGFAANATAFGEAWASEQLQTWRRRLGRRCSGIGSGSVIEGAERLILASARALAVSEDSGDGGDQGEHLPMQAGIVDHHHAISRALLLMGASEEARGHAREAERKLLATVAAGETKVAGCGVAGDKRCSSPHGDAVLAATAASAAAAAATAFALHLEITLLSCTPVVLESPESALSLRKSLMVALGRLKKGETTFWGSIADPLAVGVRAKYLTTYQGLDDRAVAIAFATAFDEISGGALTYYSPQLLQRRDTSDHPGPDSGNDSGMSEGEESPWPTRLNTNAPSSSTVKSKEPSESSQAKKGTTNAAATLAAAAAATTTTTTTRGVNPRCEAGSRTKRIRVGFLSAHFWWHSVGRLTVGLLESLSSSCSLEIFVIDASVAAGSSSTGGQAGPILNDVSGEQAGTGNHDGNTIIGRLNAAGASVVRLQAVPAGATTIHIASAQTTHAPADSDSRKTASFALHSARETVAALELDVLVYGDVGMDALTTRLAHSRLSPVQVAFWGHPGTTGLPTIDYFITSDLFEGDRIAHISTITSGNDDDNFVENDAENTATAVLDDESAKPRVGLEVHNRQGAFSEQLVRLGGLGIVFDDPAETFGLDPACDASNDPTGTGTLSRDTPLHHDIDPAKSGATAAERQHDHTGIGNGIANGRGDSKHGRVMPSGENDKASREAALKKSAESNRPRLFVCAQSLVKMHPAFDAILAGILAADPRAQILLLRDSRQLLWHSRFRRRLRAAVDAAERQQVIPPRPPPVASPDAATAATAGEGAAGEGAAGEGAVAERANNATIWGDNHPSSLLSRRVEDFWSRVHFVSTLSGREFFRLQCRADVVLDPFPFGGGVTTLEALACGTPVVTAGALQSVHRLAEGMIVTAAAAAAAAAAATEAEVAAATKTQEGWSGQSPGESPLEGSTSTKRSGEIPGGNASEGMRQTTGGDRENIADGGCTVEGHCLISTAAEVDAGVLVDALVARSKSEYIAKAVAVAAPGALKNRVRRALCRGRDGLLHGYGGSSVATDWERFLRNAAASASSSRFYEMD